MTQYILFWYIAETLPPDVETTVNEETSRLSPHNSASNPKENFANSVNSKLHASSSPYIHPPPFPPDLTLQARLGQDPVDCVPPRHEGTGVDEEEACYQSFLLSIAEAMDKLAVTSAVMVDVVKRGWEGVLLRRVIEGEANIGNG